MAMADDRDPSMFVHEQGNQSLDGIFRLIEVAGQHQPLDVVLAAMCADVATTAGADVVSIYVREDGDEGEVFTMRGSAPPSTSASRPVALNVASRACAASACRAGPPWGAPRYCPRWPRWCGRRRCRPRRAGRHCPLIRWRGACAPIWSAPRRTPR